MGDTIRILSNIRIDGIGSSPEMILSAQKKTWGQKGKIWLVSRVFGRKL